MLLKSETSRRKFQLILYNQSRENYVWNSKGISDNPRQRCAIFRRTHRCIPMAHVYRKSKEISPLQFRLVEARIRDGTRDTPGGFWDEKFRQKLQVSPAYPEAFNSPFTDPHASLQPLFVARRVELHIVFSHVLAHALRSGRKVSRKYRP